MKKKTGEIAEILKHMVREKIFYQLFSREREESLLFNYPYRKITDSDLVMVPCLRFENGITIPVKHGYARELGISEEDLFKMADDNLMAENYCFMKIGKIMSEKMGFMPEDTSLPECNCYVLTNESKLLGASLMMAPGMLLKIREKLNSDFFILPSSRHEVLILPDDGEMKKEMLSAMFQTINHSVLDSQDILSDNVYYYKKPEGMQKAA